MFQHLTRRERSGERRSVLRGLAVSLAVHVALIGGALLAGRAGYDFLTDVGTPTGISEGPAGGGGGGGGGGEMVTYVEIAPAPAAETAEEALVVVEPEPTEPEPEPEPVPEPRPQPPATPAAPAPSVAPATGTAGAGAEAGSGGGRGAGQGPGTGPGVGPGSGGGTGGGTGGGVGSGTGPGTGEGRIQPPVPEVLLLPPPKPPKAVRGSTLVLRVSIDARGEVRDVEFRSTGDRRYDRELRRVAMDWRFRPARDPANRPVAVDYDVRLDF